MVLSSFPSFAEEKKLWKKGFDLIIGIDEVGRGSWAGPVVVSACAFTSQTKNSTIESLGINDSKALKSQKRVRLAEKIEERSKAWTIGAVGVSIINRVGIGKATAMAMRQAISELISNIKIRNSKQIQNPNAQNDAIKDRYSRFAGSKSLEFRISNFGFTKAFVLVDAFHIRYLKGIGLKNQKAIIKGDQKSISIAAASILAKVYRDKLMRKLAKKYPQYGWGRNKGYGTRDHQQGILKYGMTRLHRKAFVETYLKRLKGNRC